MPAVKQGGRESLFGALLGLNCCLQNLDSIRVVEVIMISKPDQVIFLWNIREAVYEDYDQGKSTTEWFKEDIHALN